MDDWWQIAALLLFAVVVTVGVGLLVWHFDRPRRIRKAYAREWDFTDRRGSLAEPATPKFI